MLEAKELIVLSDIHLGPENAKGLFRADKEMVNCLNWILNNKEDCYVVLAGDIFDYLVLSEDEQIADFHNCNLLASRTESIIEKHPEIFDCLAILNSSRKHQLLFIAGNHDPELIFPKVQQIIEKRLGGIALKPVTRWTVQGETLRVKVGAANILIEHGNLFDKFNRVNHNELREVAALVNRGLSVRAESFYSIPFGSKIVLEHVIPIRKDFPWLDYLQPGAEAVYPLMREFTTLKQKASFLSALKEICWIVSKDGFTKFRAANNPAIAYRSNNVDDTFRQWLRTEEELQVEDRGIFIKATDKELIKELVLNKKDVFNISTPDGIYNEVAYLLSHDANLVITGHTHKAKIYPVGKGLYINTGTWAQLLETPKKDEPEEVWQQFIDNLRKGAQWEDTSFTRPTFASVSLSTETGDTSASLIEWKDDAPAPLSTWVWSELSAEWRRQEGK